MTYQAIVIGGSAAGLQATLSLSRAMLKVICIDSNKPCNRYAHESHNFLSHDGDKPFEIKSKSKEQIEKYTTTEFLDDAVQTIKRTDDGSFIVKCFGGRIISGQKLILAAGCDDRVEQVPIENFPKFWGNSIIPCPFCHGTEFSQKRTGFLVTDLHVMVDFVPTLYNWSKNITVFIPNEAMLSGSDSPKTLLEECERNGVAIKFNNIVKVNGGETLDSVMLDDGETIPLDVLYVHPSTTTINLLDQIVGIGVELDKKTKLIKVNESLMTNVPGVFAAGDCTSRMRSLAFAVGQGAMAGAIVAQVMAMQSWKRASTSKI